MTKNKLRYNKKYFQANQQEIFELPDEIKTMNTIKLVENYTTILPDIPSEFKTREVTSTLCHIDNLIQEIDFYQRQRRKSYLRTFMEKLVDHMDESMIDIDDLKDYQLLGNSFKNIEYSHTHKSKEQSFKEFKNQMKLKNFACIKITKPQQGVDVPYNVYLQLKRRKSVSATRGTRYLNSIVAVEETKFFLQNSIKEDDRPEEKGYFIKNIDMLESYRKSISSLEKAKTKPIFGTSSEKPVLSKEASTSSKNKSNALFNTFKTFNIEKTGHLNDKSKEGRCYKCFNFISPDSLSKCVVCNAKYHNNCKTMIDIKIETNQQTISKPNKYNSTTVNSKVCIFCHKIVLQKLEPNQAINPKLSIDMKSGDDEENELALDSSSLKEVLIKQQDLPAINYKCQRLEDGIIKLNSQNNMNNYLFMKFAHKLMKEVISDS